MLPRDSSGLVRPLRDGRQCLRRACTWSLGDHECGLAVHASDVDGHPPRALAEAAGPAQVSCLAIADSPGHRHYSRSPRQRGARGHPVGGVGPGSAGGTDRARPDRDSRPLAERHDAPPRAVGLRSCVCCPDDRAVRRAEPLRPLGTVCPRAIGVSAPQTATHGRHDHGIRPPPGRRTRALQPRPAESVVDRGLPKRSSPRPSVRDA